MGRGIIQLLATLVIWAAVAAMLTVLPAVDSGALLILGVAAFLSTAVVWTVGGAAAAAPPRPAALRDADERIATDKPKRGVNSLADVVDSLTPDQLASLEFALRQRHNALDEDDQIAMNRLTSDLESSARRDAR